MAQTTIASDIKKLSIAERILLAEELWNSIVADQNRLKVTKAQRDDLDQRIDDYYSSPDKATSWEEVRDRLKANK